MLQILNSRWFHIVLIVLGLIIIYFWIVKPLIEKAKQASTDAKLQDISSDPAIATPTSQNIADAKKILNALGGCLDDDTALMAEVVQGYDKKSFLVLRKAFAAFRKEVVEKQCSTSTPFGIVGETYNPDLRILLNEELSTDEFALIADIVG